MPVHSGPAAALTVVPPPAYVSHWSAVACYGWETLRPVPLSPVHVTVPPRCTAHNRPGLVLHRRLLSPAPGVRHGTVLSTSPSRTLVDVLTLRTTGRLEAVVLVDSALRAGDVTLAELQDELLRFAGLRAVRRARELAALARVGTRSCPESVARLQVVDAGLPCPEAGWELRDDDGVLLAEGDLVLPRLMVWGEYDGFDVHTERRQFRKDRRRALMLMRRGWWYIALTDEDLAAPHLAVAEFRHAMELAPARIAGLPWGMSPEADAAKRRLLEP